MVTCYFDLTPGSRLIPYHMPVVVGCKALKLDFASIPNAMTQPKQAHWDEFWTKPWTTDILMLCTIYVEDCL
jgi:hypothetical protein